MNNACNICFRICRVRNISKDIFVTYCSAFVSDVRRYEQTIEEVKTIQKELP